MLTKQLRSLILLKNISDFQGHQMANLLLNLTKIGQFQKVLPKE